jgi:ParB family transcriptional regulator, chromosome partitioning protein
MAKKLDIKQAVGKGLGALLATPQQVEDVIAQNTPGEAARELATSVAMLPIEFLKPTSDQPRQHFDQQALAELADSIKAHGIIQPITVKRIHAKEYQIISGERRFRASQLAGLTEMPAYIRLADEQQIVEMALIENIQREDLNPMEISYSLARLKAEFELSDEELGKRVGKPRVTITQYLRILDLNDEIKASIKAGQISMGHAKELLTFKDDPAMQMVLYKRVLNGELTVRALEQIRMNYKAEKGQKPSPAAARVPEHIRTIQDQFSAFFGAKALLKRDNSGKGQLVIKFSNDGELNRLIDSIDHKA